MSRPDRVLLTTDAVGGVWRYTIDLVHALDDAGVSCQVVGAGPEPGSACVSECTGWRRSELVWTPHALDWGGGDQSAAGADLERRARAWQAKIVHLHLPSQAIFMPPDLRVVAVSHSCLATWWEATRGGPMPDAWQDDHRRNRRGLARADCVMAPTGAHAAALRRVYGPIDRIDIVANAVAAPIGQATKEPFVLAAGRWWDAGKNGLILDCAARDIVWPVRVAGPLQAPDGTGVTFAHTAATGEVTNAHLRRAMARAAIFVSPSLYEPFGLAVLEAAAHGCALVLADIPTFRELWDGVALFADPGDAAAFARAVNDLSQDPDARQALGDAAKRAAARFTPERHLAAVLAAYRNLRAVAA